MRALLVHTEAWLLHYWFIFRWNTSASFRRYVDETFKAEEERRFNEHRSEHVTDARCPEAYLAKPHD